MTVAEALSLAVAHHQAGRLAQARQLYRQVLAQQPDHAGALHLLGLVALQSGDANAAAGLIGRAIELAPDNPTFHYNMGNTRQSQGRSEQAAECYRRVIALQPDYAEAYNNLGNSLRAQGRKDEAIAAFEQAVAARLDFADAHYNLGNVLRAAGRLDDAIASYRRALECDGRLVDAQVNLGGALHDVGRLDEAIVCYRQALALDPSCVSAHSSLVFSLNYHLGYDAAAILREHQQWNQQHAQPLARYIRPHANSRDPDRRLRIGYVSADLRDHVVGRNLLPLFIAHDHQRFDITCYAGAGRADATTERFRACSDQWRDAATLSDVQLDALIRQDGIDILVDLSLHTAGNRLLVFARKPAPVQVTFAGYPGTTGLSAIDYRLSDPYLDPPGQDDSSRYCEKVVRLADSFWCYGPPPGEEAAPVSQLPSLQSGWITFGCLGNFRKVNDVVLHLWARALLAVKDSRLLLLAPDGSARQSCLQRLESLCIGAQRIEFVSRCPREEYLRLYSRIDIGLDTFPYNGHTTSLDSFWMGVPVITLAGTVAVGRAGVSQLTNLGLPELIASDADEFVRVAAGLAADRQRLETLRRGLRQRMQASPLLDAARFAAAVESAYRGMWRQWCADQA